MGLLRKGTFVGVYCGIVTTSYPMTNRVARQQPQIIRPWQNDNNPWQENAIRALEPLTGRKAVNRMTDATPKAKTNKTDRPFKKTLRLAGACSAGVAWVNDRTSQESWDQCEMPEWLFLVSSSIRWAKRNR